MITVDGYIVAIEETDDNYLVILDKVMHKPFDPEGYQYKLRYDTLEWEMVELPPVPEPEMTDDEALTHYANELTGGNAENIQEATETLIKIIKEDK